MKRQGKHSADKLLNKLCYLFYKYVQETYPLYICVCVYIMWWLVVEAFLLGNRNSCFQTRQEIIHEILDQAWWKSLTAILWKSHTNWSHSKSWCHEPLAKGWCKEAGHEMNLKAGGREGCPVMPPRSSFARVTAAWTLPVQLQQFQHKIHTEI